MSNIIKFITDYTLTERKFEVLDKLYMISTDYQHNTIYELLITGYNNGFYERQNYLNYHVVKLPIPIIAYSKMYFDIESEIIDNNEIISLNQDGFKGMFIIGSSSKIIIEQKQNRILDEITQLSLKMKELHENLDNKEN